MDTFLRRYFWTIDLVAIGLCAVLAARATATLAEEAMRAAMAPLPRGDRSRREASSTKHPDGVSPRNIFCSACSQDTPAEPGTPLPLGNAAGALTRTDLPLRLLAIMYARAPVDPRWSVAIIRDDARKTAGPYSVGSKIHDATVDEIDEVRVTLRFADGHRAWLALLDRSGVADARAPVAEPAIRRIGEHRYEVSRAALETLASEMSARPNAARIAPQPQPGGPTRVRLLDVQPDSLLAQIGLASGDLLSTIDGADLTDRNNAVAIYARLRSSDHLSLALERNGRNITQEYDLR